MVVESYRSSARLRSKLKQQSVREWWGALVIALSTAFMILGLNGLGIFQLLEWATLDSFFRMHPPAAIDRRILIVTVGESDITRIGRWPIPDNVLAQLLQNLQKHQPRVVGLDIYRDLPVEPGYPALKSVFQQMDNLVGVEKRVGERVAPPPDLARKGQSSVADIVLDQDGKVRRGLMSVTSQDDALPKDYAPVQNGFSHELAFHYLAAQGIVPHLLEDGTRIQWGQAILQPMTGQEGGYVNADTGGYQILMNYRGPSDRFETLSLTEALSPQLADSKVHDRIVLIGTTATSLNDCFHTPYDIGGRTPGVFIHAQMTSSLIDAAFGERSLLRVWPDPWEWGWTILWSILGALLTWGLLQPNRLVRKVPAYLAVAVTLLMVALVVGISYGLFLGGWWIPVVLPTTALATSAMLSMVYHNQRLQRLASLDELTQVANRRSFDRYLQQQLWENREIALILCDVDFFKLYNDTYGHQAGDACLQQVARAIRQASRRGDLVARYGGEEFAVILPDTLPPAAAQVAERIRQQVRRLQIPHQRSTVHEFVTLSCGVATVPRHRRIVPADVIGIADQALYEAKDHGRDRVVLQPIQ